MARRAVRSTLVAGLAVLAVALAARKVFAMNCKTCGQAIPTPTGAPTFAGAKLTPADVARLCYWAGWRGAALFVATRICLGESGGNQKAVNVNSNKTVDRGLFQLNSYWFKDLLPPDVFDPYKNAARAFKSYGKGGFAAWKGGTHFHEERQALAVKGIKEAGFADQVPPVYFTDKTEPWRVFA
jgi:hypothetical protein